MVMIESWARITAGFAPRTRALLNLTLMRERYRAGLSGLPAITTTALVVGSAPEPTRPLGLDPSWFTISINASQVTAADFGIDVPDLTVFRDGITKPGTHQDAVWSALSGRSTRCLVANMGSAEDQGIAAYCAGKAYAPESVSELNRHIRGAIIAEISGSLRVNLTGGISNGIFAALLALKLGAPRVVLSGFSFTPGWYFAKGTPAHRGHVPADRAVCEAIAARRLPVYAADQKFAEAVSLPLWTGRLH